MIDEFFKFTVSAHGVVVIGILSAICLFGGVLLDSDKYAKVANTLWVCAALLASLVLIPVGIETISPTTTTVTEWKTIYTNDIDAQVKLSSYNLFSSNVHVKTGENIGDDYHWFESEQSEVKLSATKDGVSATKWVQLPKENIIVNGQLSPYSKIEKIEKRGVTEHKKYHDTESEQIRVTIDGSQTTGVKEDLEQLLK